MHAVIDTLLAQHRDLRRLIGLLEDRIAERLRGRGALDEELCAELEGQHARLARQGADLLRDMEGAISSSSLSDRVRAASGNNTSSSKAMLWRRRSA